jgi:hypothetical protein
MCHDSCHDLQECYAMVCYGMLWYAMVCYGMVWYGMLCYAMLCLLGRLG